MSGDRRVVLISGGSRGLGAALVDLLLDDGCVVATFSRTSSPALERHSERDPDGERFMWEPVDGLDLDSVRKFAIRVARRHGRIDVLINNAGMLIEGLLPLARPDDTRKIIGLNLESTIELTRICSRFMIRQQAGVIVNISSLNGIRGHRGVSIYSATKAAMDGFTRSLARELGPRGVRVNSVAPGYFESDFSSTISDKHRDQILRRTPVGRFGTVDDITSVVKFLISEGAGFVTGQTIVVDGGITC